MPAKEPGRRPARRNRALWSWMSDMDGSDPVALPLWTAAIGLAVFLFGFGAAGQCNRDFRGASLLIGLAGAVIFIAGLAAQDPGAPSDV